MQKQTSPRGFSYVTLMVCLQVPEFDGKNVSSVMGFESNQLPANAPIEDRRSAATCLQTRGMLLGVFDGHAGCACAQVKTASAQHLQPLIEHADYPLRSPISNLLTRLHVLLVIVLSSFCCFFRKSVSFEDSLTATSSSDMSQWLLLLTIVSEKALQGFLSLMSRTDMVRTSRTQKI